MSYLNIENLNFAYPKSSERVIENFSMSIEKGEIVALLGNSGCGKSTLLRLISGLEYPESGRINMGDKIIFDKTVNLAPEKREIGMIFQDYNLFPHLKVLENVSFGIREKSKKEKRELASKYIDMVGLSDHKNKYPHECSGGQQQRIAIARALAAKPKILLLDEPFSNLDEDTKKNLRLEIRDLLKKFNMSAILVSHDIKDVESVADRVIKL